MLSLLETRGGSVFNWMRALSPDYHGGFWEFYSLSNGGFYMALNERSCAVHQGMPGMRIQVDGNGYDGVLSPEASGIVATAFAINHLLFAGHHHLEDAYHRLTDFISVHPECTQIRRALD